MSQWANEHPDQVGGPNDPWTIHQSYRDASRFVRALSGDYCRECGEFLVGKARGLCEECKGARS